MTHTEFKTCMQMMRKHDPQIQEDGFMHLQAHASDYIDELMQELKQEHDTGLKCWLLELIGEAKSEKALPLLEEYLDHTNPSLRDWAISGLQKLNTKEARTLLFRRGVKK